MHRLDQNFQWLLNRLINRMNLNGEPTLLISPTAFFSRGICHLYVEMDEKSYFSKPKFITDQSKLMNTELRTFFLKRQPQTYYDYLIQEKMKHQKKNISKFPSSRKKSIFNNNLKALQTHENSSRQSKQTSSRSIALSLSRNDPTSRAHSIEPTATKQTKFTDNPSMGNPSRDHHSKEELLFDNVFVQKNKSTRFMKKASNS